MAASRRFDLSEASFTQPTSATDKLSSSVKKSMDMLSDAIKLPRPSARPFQHTDYTPTRSTFDMSSATTGLFSTGSLLCTPSGKAMLGDNTVLATPGSSFRHSVLGQTIAEEVTMANVDLLLEEDPGVTACHAIFAEFAESYRSASAQHEVFESVARYERICQDNVTLLKKLAKHSVPSHGRYNAHAVDMWSRLKLEQQTWRLVTSLYRDRIDSVTDSQLSANNTMAMDVSVRHISEKKLIDSLFECDAVLRQAQLVVDWLEHSVSDVLEDFYNKVDFHIDKMGAWENTLHMLKQQKSIGNRPVASRTFVDHLDPDAPLRQNKQLLDLDVEDDALLLDYIFACIRAGQIDEAHRVCIKVGQMWRAATLNGWRLYHDPNIIALGPGGTVQKVEGNQYRDIWKKVCWKASEDGRLPVVERSIYAALCGNLRQLLPNLNSWHDYLWAYFRVMVDQLVENHIRTSFTGPRPLVSLPTSYIEDNLTVDKIFTAIQSCSDERIRKKCSDRFYVIQKYVITSDVSSLVEEMYEWCRDELNKPHQHLLRFMAHLVLFFRSVGISTKETLCDSILECYVKLLIDDKQVELVATYVAALPRTLQVEWYAKFLQGIHEADERRHCLELAEQCGLDVVRITKLVVENIRNRDFTDIKMDIDLTLEAVTTQEDLLKIEALDWLIFNPVQRSEALRQANAIMRVFLGLRKLQACRQAVRKIPHDTYDIMCRVWQAEAGEDELPAQDANAFREFLCIQAYLDAHESFTDWFTLHHNARPKAPEIALGANFSERVAYEHRQRQYEVEVERWQHSLDLQTKTTVDKMYNVLLFVDGGWMVDSRTDGPVDETRAHQMALLRQLCLPTMCLLLHEVLHTTKHYKECIQITDCIASEQHELYKVFSTEELQNFLKKVHQSAVALLDAGLDPLGYPLS